MTGGKCGSRSLSAITARRWKIGARTGSMEAESAKLGDGALQPPGWQPEVGGRRRRLARRHPGCRRLPLLRHDDTLPGKGPDGEVVSFWVTWATSLLDPPLGGRRASFR